MQNECAYTSKLLSIMQKIKMFFFSLSAFLPFYDMHTLQKNGMEIAKKKNEIILLAHSLTCCARNNEAFGVFLECRTKQKKRVLYSCFFF
jgi:hypothetical protein